jgi:hypothetical protein
MACLRRSASAAARSSAEGPTSFVSGGGAVGAPAVSSTCTCFLAQEDIIKSDVKVNTKHRKRIIVFFIILIYLLVFMISLPKKILKIEQVQNISIFITFPNLFQEVVFEGSKNN